MTYTTASRHGCDRHAEGRDHIGNSSKLVSGDGHSEGQQDNQAEEEERTQAHLGQRYGSGGMRAHDIRLYPSVLFQVNACLHRVDGR